MNTNNLERFQLDKIDNWRSSWLPSSKQMRVGWKPHVFQCDMYSIFFANMLLGGGFKYFICSPYLGKEMVQFNEHTAAYWVEITN